MMSEESIENERVEERRRSKFASSWSTRRVLNFGVFASETISVDYGLRWESVEHPDTVARPRILVLGFRCSKHFALAKWRASASGTNAHVI